VLSGDTTDNWSLDSAGSKKVVDVIERAFGGNEYPGDAWLQGSREGEEPFEECGAFVGQTDWRALTPEFLDQHYVVLSFFSEAGFRFFMPAFLIADLRDRLRTADPVFHLVGGFSDFSVTHRVGDRDFVVRSGSTQFINPRRYGASRSSTTPASGSPCSAAKKPPPSSRISSTS
jgi:hypothetical protein